MKVSSIPAAALAVLVSGTPGCSADRILTPQPQQEKSRISLAKAG